VAVNPLQVTSVVGQGPDPEDEFVVTHITSNLRKIDHTRQGVHIEGGKTSDHREPGDRRGNRESQTYLDRRGDGPQADHRTGYHRDQQAGQDERIREHRQS
jgi:hypothetical protein